MNEEVTENVTTDSSETDETIQEETGELDSDEQQEGLEIGLEEEEKIERHLTEIVTDNGTIQVIHEITLGEIINITVLAAILLFLIIDRFVRR